MMAEKEIANSTSDGVEEVEHRLISELLSRLAPEVRVNTQRSFIARSGSVNVSATPPNTPTVGVRGSTHPSLLSTKPSPINNNIASESKEVADKVPEHVVNGVSDSQRSEYIDNSAVEALDRVLQDLYSVSDTVPLLNGSVPPSTTAAAAGDSGTTVAAFVAATDAANHDKDTPNHFSDDQGGNGTDSLTKLQEEKNPDSLSLKNNAEEDEHTLIRQCAERLSKVPGANKSANVTSVETAARSSTAVQLEEIRVKAAMKNEGPSEEHLLINSYTSTLSSNRSASSLLMSPSVRRARDRSDVGCRPDNDDDEHALINSYTSSLTHRTAASTAKTSRRSSDELDIESVEEFYETQKQVFLQLQRRNLELRRKIADMKTSAASSAAQSVRSESPSSPHSGGPWSTSEYYRYTQGDEEQASPHPSGVFNEEHSPVFVAGMNGTEKGNERTLERNARLQMLKERREQLTQQLKQLLTDETGSSSFDYENSLLSVN